MIEPAMVDVEEPSGEAAAVIDHLSLNEGLVTSVGAPNRQAVLACGDGRLYRWGPTGPSRLMHGSAFSSLRYGAGLRLTVDGLPDRCKR